MAQAKVLSILLLTALLGAALLACGGTESGSSPLDDLEANRLRIPKLGLDAHIVIKAIGGDSVFPEPGRDEVILYDFTQNPDLGGRPGQGNAIISGRGTINGVPRLFTGMERLTKGDEVQLVWRDEAYLYEVTALCEAPPAAMSSVFAKTDLPVLTLIPATSGSLNEPRLFVRAGIESDSIASGCPPGTSSARP